MLITCVAGTANAQIRYDPRAPFPDPRVRIIQESYTAAFCRPPDQLEVQFWLNDPRGGDISQLINAHRTFLKTNSDVRARAVRASYAVTFYRMPTAGEFAYWDGNVQQTGYTCEELKVFHTNYRRQNPSAR